MIVSTFTPLKAHPAAYNNVRFGNDPNYATHKALNEMLNELILIQKPGEQLSGAYPSFEFGNYLMKLKTTRFVKPHFSPFKFMKWMESLGYLPTQGRSLSNDDLYKRIKENKQKFDIKEPNDFILKVLAFGHFSNTLKIEGVPANQKMHIAKAEHLPGIPGIANILGDLTSMINDLEFGTSTFKAERDSTKWKSADSYRW